MAWSVQPRAEVEDDSIVVILPGTTYRARFFLCHDELKLIQAKQLTVDREAPMSHEDFESLAWTAANAKARELGWIV
jgi:hypothetical protein